MRLVGWLCLLATAFVGACRSSAAEAPASPESAEPRSSARWLVLGDSIAWDGRWVAHLQSWLILLDGDDAPELIPELIDCALPSETLSCLSEPEHLQHGFARPCVFERLERVLDGVRPDFVLVCYGVNDAIYQPFDEERFAAFRAGAERLAVELARRDLDFVFLTPAPFDEARASVAVGAHYDDVLARYSQWLVAQRERWSVIDLHTALGRRAAAERERVPEFTLTPDGVHLDDRGHLWFCGELVAALRRRAWTTHAETAEAVEVALEQLAPTNASALELVRTLRDAWLTATGHTRPGLPVGLPLPEAQAAAESLRQRMLASVAELRR